MVQTEKVRKEFADRLALACKKFGLDEHGRGVVLAKALGVTPKAASKWLNAESLPKPAAMKGIADYLQVDLVWLQLGVVKNTDEQGKVEYAGKLKDGLVRVIGEAILGIDGAVDMVEFYSGWLRIYSSDRDAYGLKVKGDSIWPRIQSGEFVVIEPNTLVYPGDEVFVRTRNGHNMIKIMNITRNGDYRFSSINSDHRPITIPKNDVVMVHYVSAIIKNTRYIDDDEISQGEQPV
ncbi:XRE family transcriptional regulator [Photorhabdus sp. RW14-46]|uniref:XRE family transcriptional regulator n=1 Tax=Photorhabdus sp. RW14-46 TaxID=2100168 RepID=UPI0013F4534D|nr:S24 family peptidase [Photorhabdus sp. RW14-46]NHB61236.1 phage repressor protein C [Photorhabdus sp. RW14-46]